MIRRALRWLAATPLALHLALAGTAAQAEDALVGSRDGLSFDRFVEKTLADYEVPGAVVVLVRADGTASVTGYGVRERGKPARIDADTRFQIASVSKFLTATAIGTLVDRGVVSWDKPVVEIAPETQLAVPYATQNASLRDYFAHRTGLPPYGGDLLPDLGLSQEELVRRARFLPFDRSFRASMGYSNYGIFLGHHAAARAAGMSPAELLSRAILEPLGMARSGPVRATLFADDNRASAHDRDGSVMENENVDAFSGAGAIVSTGNDMARFMRMVLAQGTSEGRRILAKTTLDEIAAASMAEGPTGPLHDPNGAAGLGCDSYHFLQARVVEKNGALNGVRTIVTLVPERGLGIAVLSNKQVTVFPEAVRAEFLERVVGPSGRDLQAEIRAEQADWASLVELPKPPAEAAPIAHPLDAYAGTYESPLYGTLAITRAGDRLAATIGGRPARLTPWSGDTFLLSFPNPDIAPGLMTFAVSGATATSIDGAAIPRTLTVSYGRFERAR